MARTPRSAGTPVKVKEKFDAALDALVEQVQQDRSILAALLCGSLSHDTVWSKSDIDLVLVTADDKKTEKNGLCLYADGINVHAVLMPRADFRKTAEGAIRNSFMHSLFAKGRLLYTHDESIRALCEQLQLLGKRDTQHQLLQAATHALPSVYKAHKWLITRNDLDYTALWILYSANALAKIEIADARRHCLRADPRTTCGKSAKPVRQRKSKTTSNAILESRASQAPASILPTRV